MRSQSEQIRVGLVGLGTIGRHVAELVSQRDGIEVVAAADTVARELPGTNIFVAQDARAVVAAQPDVIVQATSSFIRDVLDDVVHAAEQGVNVVSPCEELAFPFPRHTAAAERIAGAAQAGGATVLVPRQPRRDVRLAARHRLRHLLGRRRHSWPPCRRCQRFRQGDPHAARDRLYARELRRGHSDGSIAGHVGFQESIAMVADRLASSSTAR